MKLDAPGLVGYLRAEYSASGKWRIASFLVGLVVTLPAVGIRCNNGRKDSLLLGHREYPSSDCMVVDQL